MRPHLFIVEGKNDASRLKAYNKDFQSIITHGSAISLDALTMLDELSKTHDFILFLDPDHSGERIRRILSNRYKNVMHAFIDQEEARSKNLKKVGIEHASDGAIKNALSHIQIQSEFKSSDITHAFLYEKKLTGHKESASLRNKIALTFHLGYVNGKSLYQRLHMFGISKDQINEVIK